MGREVRRVPLDFDWPLKEIWSGYLMPDELSLPPCDDCGGSGYSTWARQLEQTFYCNFAPRDWTEIARWDDKLSQREVDLLVEKHRLHQWSLYDRIELDPPEVEDGDEVRYRWVRNGRPTPTAEEVNAAQRGRAFVHDAVNRWILTRHRCELLGVPYECGACQGRGEVGTEEQRAAHEAWCSTEPPTGDGWQLWETTSEGSPVSPVFADGEQLARWMSRNPCGFAGSVPSYPAALEWVTNSGWSPGMVSTPNGGVVDGITGMAALADRETP
jgi:hypothetical protein